MRRLFEPDPGVPGAVDAFLAGLVLAFLIWALAI